MMWRYQQVPYHSYARPWAYRGYPYPCGCPEVKGPPSPYASALEALRAHEAALLEGLKAVRAAIEEMEALQEEPKDKPEESAPAKD